MKVDSSLGVLNRRVLNEGQQVFSIGEPGHSAFLVQSGEIEIWVPTEGGGRRVLGTIAQGGLFGEMALIDGSPRMANASATKPSVIVGIPEKVIKEKMERLEKFDPLLAALMRILVRNARSAAKGGKIVHDR